MKEQLGKSAKVLLSILRDQLQSQQVLIGFLDAILSINITQNDGLFFLLPALCLLNLLKVPFFYMNGKKMDMNVLFIFFKMQNEVGNEMCD